MFPVRILFSVSTQETSNRFGCKEEQEQYKQKGLLNDEVRHTYHPYIILALICEFGGK